MVASQVQGQSSHLHRWLGRSRGGESVSVLTGNTACDPELVTCFSCVLSSAFPSINDLSTNMQSKYEYGKVPPLSSSERSFFSVDRLCKGGSIPEKETVPHRQVL